METKEVKVKIVITLLIGKKELALTETEARIIQGQLNSLFGVYSPLTILQQSTQFNNPFYTNPLCLTNTNQ
jgi:hypothetical protein